MIRLFEEVRFVEMRQNRVLAFTECTMFKLPITYCYREVNTTGVINASYSIIQSQSKHCSCPLALRKSFDILALYKSDYYYYYYSPLSSLQDNQYHTLADQPMCRSNDVVVGLIQPGSCWPMLKLECIDIQHPTTVVKRSSITVIVIWDCCRNSTEITDGIRRLPAADAFT